MASVELNGDLITDEAGFHAECKRAFGFPEFYGNSMDAWIDCLSYLRDDENMTRFKLKPNEVLDIVVNGGEGVKTRLPDLIEEVTYCVAGINERYADYGEQPALRLSLR